MDQLSGTSEKALLLCAALGLAADIERVTGLKPRVKENADGVSPHAVLIGTLGHSAMIDALVRGGKLNADEIRGKWESFLRFRRVETVIPRPAGDGTGAARCVA